MTDAAVETAAAEEEVLVSRENLVVTLTLNRPKALNAFIHPMLRKLMSELKRAEKDPSVRAVVITGAGRAFCAGADMGGLEEKFAQGQVPSLGAELEKYYNPIIRQIRRMELPVVAAVNGVAAGSGAGLAFACDIKICSSTAKFIPSYVNLGLAPASGFTHAVARSLGLSLGLEHAWTAKPISARRAEHFGLVNAVVPSGELMKTVREITDRLLKAAPRAVALTKRSFNRALDADGDSMLDYEARLQEFLGKTRDHAEGVKAFVEERPPVFKGE